MSEWQRTTIVLWVKLVALFHLMFATYFIHDEPRCLIFNSSLVLSRSLELHHDMCLKLERLLLARWWRSQKAGSYKVKECNGSDEQFPLMFGKAYLCRHVLIDYMESMIIAGGDGLRCNIIFDCLCLRKVDNIYKRDSESTRDISRAREARYPEI